MMKPTGSPAAIARVLAGRRILQDHLRRMLGVDHGDLHAGEGLDGAALVHARHEVGRHQAERQQRLVEAGRRPDRHVVRLGDLHGVAEMIAVAVRHQDQVDLADLAEVLELGRDLGGAHDPGIDHDHLAAGRGELEGGLAVPQQLGLALRLAVPASARQAATMTNRRRKIISMCSPSVVCAEPSTVLHGESSRFSVSRQSPTMQRNI